MDKNYQKNYKILRKRKISSGIVIENKKKTKNYIVWDEHNYCNVFGKKRNKKIVQENDANIIKINDIDDVYNDMPSYLKHYKSLSDEEENSPVDVDIPLAKLLQIEYKKDLAREHLNNYKTHTSTLNKKIKLIELRQNIVSDHELSNEQPKKKLNLNYVNMSKDIENLKNCNNIEKSKQIVNMDEIIPKNQNNNASQIMSFSKSDLNFTEENHIDDSLMFNDTSSRNYELSKEKSWSSCENSIINIDPLSLDDVPPPFDWIHLIYLAMKNSTEEHVTCRDIQKFIRYWFPYYRKQSCIISIQTALNSYRNIFIDGFILIKIANTEFWTIKKGFVKLIESKLMFIIKKYKNMIKSTMENPDKLQLLLDGYGVLFLGYDDNIQNAL